MDRITDRILAMHPGARRDIDFLVYAKPLDTGGYDEQIVRWDEDLLGPRDDAALAAVNLVTPASLVAYAADKRWRKEVGGITLAGIPLATDDRSKIMIMGARLAASDDPDWTTVWHGADGQAYPLNAASMIAISNAVEAHVNATFAQFADVRAGIAAGTITTTAEIDAALA
jgi:hypothetical protein